MQSANLLSRKNALLKMSFFLRKIQNVLDKGRSIVLVFEALSYSFINHYLNGYRCQIKIPFTTMGNYQHKYHFFFFFFEKKYHFFIQCSHCCRVVLSFWVTGKSTDQVRRKINHSIANSFDNFNDINFVHSSGY